LADIIATIGFRKKLIALHRSRRRAAAINYMRIRAAKIAKVEPSEVKIDPELNRILMLNAIGSTSNIKVSISASAGKAEVKRFVEKTANEHHRQRVLRRLILQQRRLLFLVANQITQRRK